ncbi:MAG: DUF2384 domain-containing protein [Rhodothermales bacterium]
MTLKTRVPDRSDLYEFLGLRQRNLVTAVREGLPFDVFERLHGILEVSGGELAEVLSIPDRTLQRRRKADRLTSEESDRLLRVAHLVNLAFMVFENDTARVVRWLTTPKSLLDGESPLARADTEPGAREVEDMLYAIEFTMPA